MVDTTRGLERLVPGFELSPINSAWPTQRQLEAALIRYEEVTYLAKQLVVANNALKRQNETLKNRVKVLKKRNWIDRLEPPIEVLEWFGSLQKRRGPKPKDDKNANQETASDIHDDDAGGGDIPSDCEPGGSCSGSPDYDQD